ncbi:MAG: phenylalanine--tRNA ligase subunit alpha [Tenericutes bacterium]|jgi:phenylalanyl-tRNA synthetase alpha chain|nr:phenylalanine--tRNA ligase subunit alpha [Mycoplasmatota bacterium]
MDNNEKLKYIVDSYNKDIKTIDDSLKLNEMRVKYLGKKSEIQEISLNLGSLSIEEKKELGKSLNEAKKYIEGDLNRLTEEIKNKELTTKLNKEKIDLTLPGTKFELGTKHPISIVREEIEELFVSMGYDVLDGPELEEDLYNFEMLNIPKGHPARDMQDSFYITEEKLLRTHTSPVQARAMLNNKEKSPIRIICSGYTYRKDNDDATHSHQFHQIEGLFIDENISMSDLKGTLELLSKKLFGESREIRIRSSYFPFTEPSIEIDISCFNCNKKGCSICKNSGWIEILGAGMVHPSVLRMGGYDPDKYSGFAFGMGLERIAMLKFGINDVRYFYSNDIRFLNQFNKIEGDSNESK